jgi:hypothetical protein
MRRPSRPAIGSARLAGVNAQPRDAGLNGFGVKYRRFGPSLQGAS